MRVPMPLVVGTRLGPYELVTLLGHGGMGEVYRARDTRLDRSVAIKILAPGITPDAAARGRLVAEARAASLLNHPNICALYDIGSHEATDFLVMELLEGETWQRAAARPAALPVGPPHRRRNRPGAGCGARTGHRPSRLEAGQRHADEDGREAARLRHRDDRPSGG
jgi:hypothetical protein